MPLSVPVGNEAFANFIKVMSLPPGERQRTFSELSNQEKAYVFRIQLALQFVKFPELTREQKDLTLEMIPKLSADTYNKDDPELVAKYAKQSEQLQQRALAIFPANEAYKIFASLSGDKEDVELLKKYEKFLTIPTMGERRRFFRETLPSERSELWKAQMVNYLATVDLSKARQELIVEIISLSTPQAFTFPTVIGEAKNIETLALDALEARANKLFSEEEVFAFFMSFGVHKIAPPINKVEADETADLRPADCDCNYFCWWGNCSGTGCRGTTSGCGWSGDVPCVFNCQ